MSAKEPTQESRVAPPRVHRDEQPPSESPRDTSDRVSLTELSEALQETITQAAPAPTEREALGPLLWGLKARQLNLQDFCRAVRVTLGQGVLMSAIGKVAQKKASQRMRSLWWRGLAFARMSAAWLELHAMVQRKLAAAEAHLPPSKRAFAREIRLRRSDSDSLREDSADLSAAGATGLVRPRRSFSGALTPPRSKRLSFEAPKPPPSIKATTRSLEHIKVTELGHIQTGVANGNDGMDVLALAASKASIIGHGEKAVQSVL